MSYRADADQGWGGYYDEQSVLGAIGGIDGLDYTPDLAPVAAGTPAYWPRDTTGDAQALNYLGYYPDDFLALHIGTTGSQSGDMGQSAGAWDPSFKQAVLDFQQGANIGADGWIGPKTRATLAAAVAAKNARTGPVAPPFVVPPITPPISPPFGPPSPEPPPGKPSQVSPPESSLPLIAAVGAGAAAIYFLFLRK